MNTGHQDGYTLLRKANGSVFLLGANTFNYMLSSQLQASVVSGTSARQINNLAANSVAGGRLYTMAVNSAGNAVGWGISSLGTLGGSQMNDAVNSPRILGGVSGVSMTIASEYMSLALRNDGTVWHWPGVITWTRTTTDVTPRQATGLTNVYRIVNGPTNSYDESRSEPLAIKSDGTVWTLEQTAVSTVPGTDGPIQTFGTNSRQVTALSDVSDISCHLDCLVLKRDGTVVLWSNAAPLPSGGLTVAATVSPVSGLSNIISIARAGNASVAVASDGRVWTWGATASINFVGVEDGPGHGQPVSTALTTPTVLTALAGAAEAACSATHCTVRLTNGQVWSWGLNSNGELGDGTTTFRSTPVQATGINLN